MPKVVSLFCYTSRPRLHAHKQARARAHAHFLISHTFIFFNIVCRSVWCFLISLQNTFFLFFFFSGGYAYYRAFSVHTEHNIPFEYLFRRLLYVTSFAEIWWTLELRPFQNTSFVTGVPGLGVGIYMCKIIIRDCHGERFSLQVRTLHLTKEF